MSRHGVWSGEAQAVFTALGRPAFWASLGGKVLLAALGVGVLVAPGERSQLTLLFLWCLLGTLYLAGVAVGLLVASRFAASDGPPLLNEIGRWPRTASILTALVACGVGVFAAVQHTLIDTTSPTGWSANLTGIWAMLLAWGLLHWGFAQVYLQQYYRLPSATLQFPDDDKPGVLEFAYLSYGVAVSLAVSDVVVVTRRARALVLLHSVLSFFVNGLIIVTALAALTELGRLR